MVLPRGVSGQLMGLTRRKPRRIHLLYSVPVCSSKPEASVLQSGTAVQLLTPAQGGDGSTRVERADPALQGQWGLTSA